MLHIFMRATHVYFEPQEWWLFSEWQIFCHIVEMPDSVLSCLLKDFPFSSMMTFLWDNFGMTVIIIEPVSMFGASMQRNSVCPWKRIFIFQENYLVMASGSPVWLHLSAFVVLTWVWPCCLVTPHLLLQTLAWFNLVRRSPLPPFYPLTQIPRSASGELVCASQLWSQRPLERSSSQHSTVAAGTLELLVHSNMWKMSSCFDVCQSSHSLLTGACRSDEGIIPSLRRICRT